MARILREDPCAEVLVEALNAREAANRALLLTALDNTELSLPAARALHRRTTRGPSPDESRVATRVFARHRSADVRHHLLAWLERAPAERDLAPLRASAGDPANAAALLLLAGERERFPDALRGFEPSEVRWSAFRSAQDRFDEATLIAFAIVESGCTRSEIEAAKRDVREEHPTEPCAEWAEARAR